MGRLMGLWAVGILILVIAVVYGLKQEREREEGSRVSPKHNDPAVRESPTRKRRPTRDEVLASALRVEKKCCEEMNQLIAAGVRGPRLMEATDKWNMAKYTVTVLKTLPEDADMDAFRREIEGGSGGR